MQVTQKLFNWLSFVLQHFLKYSLGKWMPPSRLQAFISHASRKWHGRQFAVERNTRSFMRGKLFDSKTDVLKQCFNEPSPTWGAVFRRWFIPLTANVDFCSGGGSIHFQKAFAFSIVSAELPEKDTLVTSAMMFLFSFPGMHGNKVF